MILMVSVQNLIEALEALQGGADIVDVKNLQEALVGSAHPRVVKDVREAVPLENHVSVTLGVVPNQVGTVAMAAYTAGVLKATSVKVGFMKTEYEAAVEILLASRDALEGFDTKLIGSLFADNPLYDGLDPHLMVRLAKEGLCDGFLIDTLTKDGRNLFDFLAEEELRDMVLEGKELGMSTALSGHLRIQDLDELARINPDIVGVRGAVCQKGDRQTGVHREAVAEFKRQLGRRESGEIDVYDGVSALSSDGNGTGASGNGWIVIDGTGKTCAGIIAALSEQMGRDRESFVEVVIPDVLNTYDIIVWAEKGRHSILTQRKDSEGSVRMLIKP
ncbi:MAG: (5-formylfuran-3-yl)methyl phosphate synthase [Chloroflexi bacterium]|nr:(5-formylfuran-3-yl)methyl phosphate synthase [Chloroflexota bacterium]